MSAVITYGVACTSKRCGRTFVVITAPTPAARRRHLAKPCPYCGKTGVELRPAGPA